MKYYNHFFSSVITVTIIVDIVVVIKLLKTFVQHKVANNTRTQFFLQDIY